jgi:hypothetical protein
MLKKKGWDLKSEPIIVKEEINDNDTDSGRWDPDQLHFRS